MKYIELAFVVVCVVASLQVLGRRVPIPMAALQMAAGMGLSAVAGLDDLREQSSLLFVMLVPPLLYVEAWHIPRRELLRALRPVLGLAIGLVALTILIVGIGLHAIVPGMPLAMAFALAAALASTDTVAVGSVMRSMPLPPRLQVLLSGEGLLNDSVALVAFKVAVAAAVTASFSADEAALSLLTVSAGGLLTGAAVACLASALRRILKASHADSVEADTTLSLLIPYAAYLASEQLGVSGVLAVVAAGLFAGALERDHLQAAARLHGRALWGTVTLVLNGAVFVMLGMEMRQVLHRVEGYSGWSLLGYVSLLTLTLFTVRLVWALMLNRMSKRKRAAAGEGPPAFGLVLVTVLCGVRGSLALSATLSIPLLTSAGAAMPGRDLAVFLAASTIGATMLLSGVILPFLKRLPITDDLDDPGAPTVQQIRKLVAEAGMRVIDGASLAHVSTAASEWAAALRQVYQSRIAGLTAADASTAAAQPSDLAAQRDLSMRVLRAQRLELGRLHSEQALARSVVQELELELDLAEMAIDKLDWRGYGRV